jgi:branched-chain amino acid transport system substrate-binding protein
MGIELFLNTQHNICRENTILQLPKCRCASVRPAIRFAKDQPLNYQQQENAMMAIKVLHQKLITALMLSSLIIGLTGCAPAATVAPPTQSATAVVLSDISTARPTETPIRTPSQTPFVPKATIKIVAHLPLTGSQSTSATDVEFGAELAVEQLAGPLNELGYKVELVTYDDKNDIDVAVANAKEFTLEPEILCGVGNFSSRITVQAMEVYHKAALAFISPSNTSTAVTDRGFLEINRIVGRDDLQGVAAAQFAQSQGFTTVYIISHKGAYGGKNAAAFKREADRLGLTISGNQITVLKEKFDSIITRVLTAKPDMVFFAGLDDQAGPFFRETRAAGYMGTFLSIGGSPALVDLAGPFSIEGGGLYYIETVAPVSYYPDAVSFRQDFLLNFGFSPLPYAAQAYDSAGICMKAIEEASKAKGGDLPTRSEVAEAIRALVDYKGITGTYNFNAKGDSTLAEYFVYEVVSVDPRKWSQNTVTASFKVELPK